MSSNESTRQRPRRASASLVSEDQAIPPLFIVRSRQRSVCKNRECPKQPV